MSPTSPFPYALRRARVVMSPTSGDAREVEGVLNPAAGRGPDGEPYLLPRLVAAGNVSRVGLARMIITDGVPTGVDRLGVAPDGRLSLAVLHRPMGPLGDTNSGGGPPPVRVPEGWLVLHHGVTGQLEPGVAQQLGVRYVAGGMILDAEQPWQVVTRSPEALLEPETADEISGIVPHVIFLTAVEAIDGERSVFYGMADTSIGVARIVGVE